MTPTNKLTASGIEHKVAQLINQAPFFGDADEFKRRNRPSDGMIPAHEGFNPMKHPNRGATNHDERLIDHVEFAVGESPTQICFHRPAPCGGFAHPRIKNCIPTTTRPLGSTHRNTGVAQNRIGSL